MKSEPKPDRLLTTPEAAAMLALSESYLWQGKPVDLPRVRIGRAVRFRLSHIEQWIDRHTTCTADSARAAVARTLTQRKIR